MAAFPAGPKLADGNEAFLIGTQTGDMAKIARMYGYKEPTTLTDGNFKETVKRMNRDTPIFIEKGHTLMEQNIRELEAEKLRRNLLILSNDRPTINTTDEQIADHLSISADDVDSGNEDSTSEFSRGRKRKSGTTKPSPTKQRRVIDAIPIHLLPDCSNGKEIPRKIDLNKPFGTDTTDSGSSLIAGDLEHKIIVEHIKADPETTTSEEIISKSRSEITTRYVLPMQQYSVSIDGKEDVEKSLVSIAYTADITRKATKNSKLITCHLTLKMSSTSIDEKKPMANSTGNSAEGFFKDTAKLHIFYPEGWKKVQLPNAPERTVIKQSTSEFEVIVGKHPTEERNFTICTDDPTLPSIGICCTEEKCERVTGWKLFYTALEGDQWKEHFEQPVMKKKKVKGIADLAQGHMSVNAGGAFEGPKDFDDTASFTLSILATFRLLRINRWNQKRCYSLTFIKSLKIDLDMSEVVRPGFCQWPYS